MVASLPDFSKVRALVVGDVMLDNYVHGLVTRISPEAPVPVFNAINETYTAGGAANVARNLAALGCRVELIGAIGKDPEGEILVRELDRARIKHIFDFVFAKETTNKTRLVVGDKHLLRMDRDSQAQWLNSSVRHFSRWLTRKLKQTDVVILSDYGKGVLCETVCQVIISGSRKAGVPVMVDPKGNDYSKYAGATLMKPNLKEFIEASRCTVDFHEPDWQGKVSEVAIKMGRRLHVDAILVTLGEKGMIYVPTARCQKPLYLAAEAKEVFDVSGAGDTSMSVISAALALNMPIPEAVGLANTASGMAVAKSGTAVVSASELEVASCMKSHRKVMQLEECVRVTAAMKRQGKVIGFTNGCFDCCHLGHIKSIQAAKSLCDILVVGVNSDNWITKHKGKDRPIQDEATRIGVLAALECVDFIVVFSSETALPVVRKIKPQIIAKEGYEIENWLEGRYVQSIGGKAVELRHVEGYSTTALVSRMKGTG